MADNKSCEVYKPSEEAFNVRRKILKRKLEHCRSITPEQVDTIIDLFKEGNSETNPLALTVEIDVFKCSSCKRPLLKSNTYNNEGLVCAGCKCPIREVNEAGTSKKDKNTLDSVTENLKGTQRKLHDQFGPERPKNKKGPLLTIELQDESSVPRVFYKGEEIRLKQNVYFDWDTDTSIPGGLTYAIEHAVTDEGHAVVNRIERRVKGHAT